jgi:hypothetical protein
MTVSRFASAPGFNAMRADLIRRGLLDDSGSVTPAGDVYVDQLLMDLRNAEALEPPALAVIWNTGKRATR